MSTLYQIMLSFVHTRSTLLIPWCHVAAPYYIVDTYAMATTFMGQDRVIRWKFRTKIILFILEKWPYLLHHTFVAVGYLIIVVSKLCIASKYVYTD